MVMQNIICALQVLINRQYDKCEKINNEISLHVRYELPLNNYCFA